MEYERIHKPSPRQSGGFTVSPKKLRSILLGLEKTQKEEEEENEPDCIDGQEMVGSNERRGSIIDRSNLECSTSMSNSNSTGSGPHRLKVKIHDEDSFDTDSVSSGFDFQKQNPVAPVQKFKFNAPTALLPPFSKPTPSKWDDAQKWISSPNSNKPGNGRRNGKSGFLVNKIVMEKNLGELNLNLNLKKVEFNKASKIDVIENGVFENNGFDKGGFGKNVSWVDEPFGFVDLAINGVDKPLVDSPVPLRQPNPSLLNQNNSSHTISLPVPEVRSVSMRDMGTEMTPIPSQEPSRTATPLQASTPIRSLDSSRTSTPSRNEKELQMKTRNEIMELGEQLGRPNITAWAKSRGQDGNNTPVRVRNVPPDQDKGDVEIRASDWEEAEKAKYLARFKQEEIKIQAWENHQKAKIEAAVQKIEVDIEKIRARAQEKLMNKSAATRHKADQKRAKAEAKKKKDAERTQKQADHIRRTGHVPSRYSWWGFCL